MLRLIVNKWRLFGSTLLVVLAMILTTGSSVMAYSGSSAVSYANSWSSNASTPRNVNNYPRYYKDYSPNDCMNFVSQALYAGGFPEVDAYLDRVSNTAWWWYPSDPSHAEGTYTWTSTTYMLNFATYYNGVKLELESSPYYLSAGDFVLMDLTYPYNSGGPTHARFYVGWGYNAYDGQFTQMIDQHTNEHWHYPIDYLIDPSWDWWNVHVL